MLGNSPKPGSSLQTDLRTLWISGSQRWHRVRAISIMTAQYSNILLMNTFLVGKNVRKLGPCPLQQTSTVLLLKWLELSETCHQGRKGTISLPAQTLQTWKCLSRSFHVALCLSRETVIMSSLDLRPRASPPNHKERAGAFPCRGADWWPGTVPDTITQPWLRLQQAYQAVGGKTLKENCQTTAQRPEQSRNLGT